MLSVVEALRKFCRPYGTKTNYVNRFPSDKSLGYYQKSLRDKNSCSRSQTPVWERHFTKLRFASILESLKLQHIVKQSFRKMRYEAGAS